MRPAHQSVLAPERALRPCAVRPRADCRRRPRDERSLCAMGGRLSLAPCPRCGLVLGVPVLQQKEVARCTRCGARVRGGGRGRARNTRSACAALAALLLYPPAMALPVLRLERLGQASESSVWTGSLGLMREGHFAIGMLIFLCSIVLPLLKLATILMLVQRPRRLSATQRARAWHLLEIAGRFGMLDVLLVSLLVAWLKLGEWIEVRAGPAALAFGACVAASLLASAWFDPHALWEEERTA